MSSDNKSPVWHPFTPMLRWGVEDPALEIDRADGHFLIDCEGRRYLDGVSSLWCNVFGHRRPEIDRAIRAQLDRVAHSTLLGLTHAPAIELAQRLVTIAPPGLTRVFYSDSGSTAVEAALKIAIQYWREVERPAKHRLVALENAYHGDTLGAVSVGGIARFHDAFRPLVTPVLRVPADANALATLFAERGGEIAALIVEPLVQGAAGMLLQPPGFLAAAAETCLRHDVLFIADEVATGFGRTGTMFACEQQSVTPDLLCVGKGLTGGYLPLAATLATERIYEAFLGAHDTPRTFFHGHTYSGNPLGCAAALATLDLFGRERVLERLPRTIQRVANVLAERIAPLRAVREVRQCGLMVGIELSAPAGSGAGHRVCMGARSHGVILRPLGNVVVWMPPLLISDEELDLLGSATSAAIREVSGERST